MTTADRAYLGSPVMNKYYSSYVSMSKKTAKANIQRIYSFNQFSEDTYKLSLDKLVSKLLAKELDVYDVLSSFAAYLSTKCKISPITLNRRVTTAKHFLTFNDIDIVEMKFKIKVRLPRAVRKEKEPLSKEDVRDILLAASNINVKTYLMLLAATGMRATEALSIRYKDLDFKSNPPRVTIRGEFTKTKVQRYVYFTQECTKQLMDYLAYKHRTRRLSFNEKKHGKVLRVQKYVTPEPRPDDLIFGIYHQKKDVVPSVESLYIQYLLKVNHVLDRIGKGEREDGSKLRKITRHSFRRFVKSTISDLGYADFSEWFIGHVGSTYYRKKDNEKAELFKKIEPYLTFLDYSTLEAKGADQQTRLDQIQEELQKERQERAKLYEQLYKKGIITKE